MPSSHEIIEHIVLFRVKEGLTPSQLDEMFENVSSLRRHPSVLFLSMGPVHRVRSPSSDQYFTHIMHTRHTNKEDVLVYYDDPIHLEVKAKVVPLLDEVLAFDWVVQPGGIDGPVSMPAGTAVKLQLLKLKNNDHDQVAAAAAAAADDDQAVVAVKKEKVEVAPQAAQPQTKKEEQVPDAVMEIEVEVEGVKGLAKVVDLKVHNNDNNINQKVEVDHLDLVAAAKVVETQVVDQVKADINDQETIVNNNNYYYNNNNNNTTTAQSAASKVIEVIAGLKAKVSGLKHLSYGDNFMPDLAKGFSVCLLGVFNGSDDMEKVEAVFNVDDHKEYCIDRSIVIDYLVLPQPNQPAEAEPDASSTAPTTAVAVASSVVEASPGAVAAP